MILYISLLLIYISSDEPYWSTGDSNRLLNDGLDALFNYDLPLASLKFDSLTHLEPDRPEGFALKSSCAFWKFLLSEKDSDFNDLLLCSEVAHEKVEAYLEKHKQKPKSVALAKYFLAEHHLQLGAADARRQSFAQAAIHLHKAKGLYKDALKIDSTFFDAAKGVGFISFFSSLIPDSYKWLASVFGYEGTREEGMRKLQLASEKGLYTQRESKFYLAMFKYLFYNKFEEAEQDLLALSNQFPNSTALNYTLGSFYFKYKKIDVASRYLQAAIDELQKNSSNEFSGYALFRLAELKFRLNHFAEAREMYLKYLSVLNLELYRAQTFYKLGLCEELLGNRALGMSYYRQARSSTDNPDERYARRKAKELLVHPLTYCDSLLLIAKNEFDAGAYPQAIDHLQMLLLTDIRNVDQRTELYYRLARCFDETNQFEKAIAYYQQCYVLHAERERFFAPQSRLHLGRLYARLGNKAAATEEFEKALRYVSYDFEKELRREIILDLEKLSQ